METLAKLNALVERAPSKGSGQLEVRQNSVREHQTHLVPLIRAESSDRVISYHIVLVPHIPGEHPVVKSIAYEWWLFYGRWSPSRTYCLGSEFR